MAKLDSSGGGYPESVDQKENVRAGISERSQDRCLLSSIAKYA